MKSSAGACGIAVCFCFVLLTATTARGSVASVGASSVAN